MSKYLTGMKRLKLIQNYLNGKEDPEYEVFPTKREGKYIVKKRDKPMDTESAPSDQKADDEDTHEETVEEQHHEEETVKEQMPSEKEPPKEIARPKTPKRIAPKNPAIPVVKNTNAYDPTVSIEILNQLKSLGEELKQEREAKQQKKLIKQTVQRQMYKQQYRQQPVIEEDDYDEEPIEEQPVYQPHPRPVFVRRRVNLLK